MNRDEAYNILYKRDGKCNRDEDILGILKDIIFNHRKCDTENIAKIDRWNIYDPDCLHIVYTVRVNRFAEFSYDSHQAVVLISEFTTRYRDYQLNKVL
jgi:hypothetical protein